MISASQRVTAASEFVAVVVQVTHLSSGPSFQSLNSLSKAECVPRQCLFLWFVTLKAVLKLSYAKN